MTVLWLLILLCVILEGFFSGSELALVSTDKLAVRTQKDSGDRSAELLARFLEEPERILTTTLIGTNVSVVSATTLFAVVVHQSAWIPDEHASLLTILILSPCLLLFGELIPKSIYRHYSSRVGPIVIRPLTLLSTLLFPLVALVRGLASLLMDVLGAPRRSHLEVSREELRVLLDYGEEPSEVTTEGEVIEQAEREMIERIFQFPEVTVKEAMRPLIDVVAINEEASLSEAIELFVSSGFSRIPVFHERVDDIVGIIRAVDILRLPDPTGRRAASLTRPVPYVPETQKAELLLTELQHQRQGMAVVVDEYGGAQGVVTLEDILEEIVGEIEDEHDEPVADIRKRGELEYLVSARVEVDHLNEMLELGIPDGDYETLAGFLLEHFGRIPRDGDVCETERAVMTVVAGTSRVIEEVQVVLREPEMIEEPTI